MRKRALLEPNEAAEAHSWFVSKVGDFISFFPSDNFSLRIVSIEPCKHICFSLFGLKSRLGHFLVVAANETLPHFPTRRSVKEEDELSFSQHFFLRSQGRRRNHRERKISLLLSLLCIPEGVAGGAVRTRRGPSTTPRSQTLRQHSVIKFGFLLLLLLLPVFEHDARTQRENMEATTAEANSNDSYHFPIFMAAQSNLPRDLLLS